MEYRVRNEETVPSPALLYYREQIERNTDLVIEMAGGAERMWPHIKTHKCREIIRMQMARGITRFKCATIAEGEILGQCGAEHVLVAYPLVGPNIGRFLRLRERYPGTRFYALGDSAEALEALGKAHGGAASPLPVFVDVDYGMNRTGVPLDGLEAFCGAVSGMAGIAIAGLHCYDGHNKAPDREERRREAEAGNRRVLEFCRGRGWMLIMGGTPSFPCHADFEGLYLSPGTAFVMDYAYHSTLPDLALLEPAAAVLTRVVSHPGAGRFTLDVGCKAIACDPTGLRGVIVGMEGLAEPVLHSEEHWVFRMKEGLEEERPAIGEVLYVVPTHICPTTALYPEILVVEHGAVANVWEVAARNRFLHL